MGRTFEGARRAVHQIGWYWKSLMGDNHYQRYLELRPQTEKTKLIQDLIRQARLSFAASLPLAFSAADLSACAIAPSFPDIKSILR